jgi:hypothetical protein
MTILQSRLSGLYFKDFGWWVPRAAEALQFETMDGARKFMAVERVADVAAPHWQSYASPVPR